jgi:hypothetical protein
VMLCKDQFFVQFFVILIDDLHRIITREGMLKKFTDDTKLALSSQNRYERRGTILFFSLLVLDLYKFGLINHLGEMNSVFKKTTKSKEIE